MARIWTLNIQRDQTIRFIESLFSIFKANNYALRSHCIPIQGKRNQLNYMWELEKRHKHTHTETGKWSTQRLNYRLNFYIFIYVWSMTMCRIQIGWMVGWMDECNLYMYVRYYYVMPVFLQPIQTPMQTHSTMDSELDQFPRH